MSNHATSARHKADEFSIDLTLRHESFDPAAISRSLSMRPSFSVKAGERASSGGVWQSVVAGGSSDAEFSAALKTTVSVLAGHRKFLDDFTASGGEIHITLNHVAEVSIATDFKDGEEDERRFKMFELDLYPEFMDSLAAMGIALKVCVWA
jgi:hypothetical protein